MEAKASSAKNTLSKSDLNSPAQYDQKYVQENGEEPRLPGLQQYTNEQTFFISNTQFYCEKKKESAAMQLARIDNHSPTVFRVNGVFSNIEAFANTFKCPPNYPLNPKLMCSVW